MRPCVPTNGTKFFGRHASPSNAEFTAPQSGARRSRARKGADGRISAEKLGLHDQLRRAVDCAPCQLSAPLRLNVAAPVRARKTRFKPKKSGLHNKPRRAVDCAPYQLSAPLRLNVAALVRARTVGFQPRNQVCINQPRRAVDCALYLTLYASGVKDWRRSFWSAVLQHRFRFD